MKKGGSNHTLLYEEVPDSDYLACLEQHKNWLHALFWSGTNLWSEMGWTRELRLVGCDAQVDAKTGAHSATASGQKLPH